MSVEIIKANLRLIYPDTNLWNGLLDQHVNPRDLLAGLAQRGASLALSGQTVYELAKAFIKAADRGKELFRYVKACVDTGIVGAHDNMRLLQEEVTALNTRAEKVVAYYSPEEYGALRVEVGKLAEGILDERTKSFLTSRKEFSKSTRDGQRDHLKNRKDIRKRLRAIREDQLEGWLSEQILRDDGAAVLTSHLVRIYDGLSVDLAILNALALLRHPASRIAKGVVRADLYSNWRCANRKSNKKDLVDDMYHVLNASYCDFYATAEPKQAEYAPLLLTRWTRVAIYAGDAPLGDWLLSLVC